MAKIEVYGKIVDFPLLDKLGEYAPYHLYIIYTDDNEHKTVLRAGPERNNFLGAIKDNVKIIPDKFGPDHVDYPKGNSKHPNKLLFKGDDQYAQDYFNKMLATAEAINREGFDYKLPLIGHVQNSNTAVKRMIEAAGLELELPKLNGNSYIWAPGIDGHFTHTYIDTITDSTIIPNLNSPQYERHISQDYSKIYYVNRDSGLRVYEQETYARKVGDTYTVEGISEQHIAAKFNLPVERIVENLAESSDVRQSNIKSFTILTEANTASKTHLADKEYGPPIPAKTKASESTKSETSGSSTGSFSTNDKSGIPLSWSFFNQWSWSNPFSQSYIPAGSIFTMYRPAFLNKPDFGSSFDNHLINEPSWLYTGKNSEPDKYNKVKQEFRYLVKECLGSSFCQDTTDTLMDKAVKMVYGWVDRPSSVFTSMDKWFEAQSAARSFAFESSISLTRKGFTIGPWSHPLREELKYAVSHVSPLVLDLNGDGIKLYPYTKGVCFDIDNDGFAEKVGWVSAEDGQLARDVNENGQIDDITELFGDDLISAYFKLSLLDSNSDKVIDSGDENFNELLIWQDKNSNGFSEPGELLTLKQAGIKSISLITKPDDRLIEGNTITATSVFTFEDGKQGEVADVHYHNDDMDSWYSGRKMEPKANEQEYEEHVKKFRKEALEKLLTKIKAPDDIDVNKDWVWEIIQEKATSYIEEYKRQKDKKSAELFAKVIQLNEGKQKEYQRLCEEVQKTLREETDKRYLENREAVLEELRNEIQRRLDEEKKNIHSRYLQEFNKEDEALFARINEQINQAKQVILQTAKSNHWTQQQYDQAVQNEKDKYQAQYASEHKVLSEKYDQDEIKEVVEAGKKYQQELDESSNKLEERLIETERSRFERLSHSKNHECKLGKKGLKTVILDQYHKYSQASLKHIEELDKVIKTEVNNVYKFFVNKIMLRAATMEADFDNVNCSGNATYTNYRDVDNRLGEVSDWLNDEIFIYQKSQLNNTEQGYRIKIEPETLLMPQMRGYGKIPALHISMTANSHLKNLVLNFMTLQASEFSKVHERVMAILYEWAGVAEIDEDARATAGGVNIEARKVAFIEQVTGQEFRQLGAAKFVGQHASTAVQKAWDIALMRSTKNLLVQGPLASIFPKAEYIFANDNTKLNSTLEEILSAAKEFASDISTLDLGLNLLFGKSSTVYDFWVQLGYILAYSISELNTSIEEINARLTELAGEPVMINLGIFGLIGDERDNTIKGTSGSDYIKGLGGNDRLYGLDGSDHIEGDEDNDEIYGNDGIDRLHGGAGDDRMYGGEGRDFMYGDDGNDEMNGEEGDDHMEGGPGSDTMDGGNGTNTLSYGESKEGVYVNLATQEARKGDAEGDKFKNFQDIGGSDYDDELIGDNQDNEINGEKGNDVIHGGEGNDKLFGAPGEDYLYGDEGDDILTGFEDPDHMDGGVGDDTVDYHHPYSTEGVKVDLTKGKGIGGYAHEDTYKNIENIFGSKFGDVLRGDNTTNVIIGMEGDDHIEGGDGDDVIIGDRGHDKAFGDEGNDTVILNGDGDSANGGEGEDTLSYRDSTEPVNLNMVTGIGVTNKIYEDTFKDFENAEGTKFDDEITGDSKDNKLSGLKGNDKIKGGKGNDILAGGEGDDILYGEDGDDVFIGDYGRDEIDGGGGIDRVNYANEQKEGIRINLGERTAQGGIAEGDRLKDIEGIIGTKFNDILLGDENSNQLYGMEGDDHIEGGNGNDILSGGKGSNILDGGEGKDYISYEHSEKGITIKLQEGTSTDGESYSDIFSNIENVLGSEYDDTITGDDSSNHLFGGDGNDYIDGGAFSDTISGGNGNNRLIGGSGNDIFLLVEGINAVDGGEGEDIINYSSYLSEEFEEVANHARLIKGGGALTTLPLDLRFIKKPVISYTEGPIVTHKTGFKISLLFKQVIKENSLTDTIIGVESVIGTHYDDIITGNEEDNELNGLNGNDWINGGKGNDKLIFGYGSSILYGDEGDDCFTFSDSSRDYRNIIIAGVAEIDGGEGTDTLDLASYPVAVRINMDASRILYGTEQYGLKSIEKIIATSLDDIIRDSEDGEVIDAGAGDDKIYLSDGDDAVNCGEGNDIVYLFGSGEKRLYGGYGKDTYVITPEFVSKKNTIIVDFETNAPSDRIDVREFPNIKGISDLNIEQYIADGHKFALIKIANDKEISLYNIDIHQLQASNFIFFENEDYLQSINYLEQDHNGYTALTSAIKENDLAGVKAILDQASKDGNLEKLLMLKDTNGNSGLIQSLLAGNQAITLEIFGRLFTDKEMLGNVLKLENNAKTSALRIIVQSDAHQMFREIMELADKQSSDNMSSEFASISDSSGKTILHWLMIEEKQRFIDVILGAPLLDFVFLLKDNNGYNPLHWAVEKTNVASVLKLLERAQSDDSLLREMILANDNKANSALVLAMIKYHNAAGVWKQKFDLMIKYILDAIVQSNDQDLIRDILLQANKAGYTPFNHLMKDVNLKLAEHFFIKAKEAGTLKAVLEIDINGKKLQEVFADKSEVISRIINEKSHEPIAKNHEFQANGDASVTLNLLEGVRGSSIDKLAVVKVNPKHECEGIFGGIVDGKVLFTPTSNKEGECKFTYVIEYGQGAKVTADSIIHVHAVPPYYQAALVEGINEDIGL